MFGAARARDRLAQDALKAFEKALLPHKPIRVWSTADIEDGLKALDGLEDVIADVSGVEPNTLDSMLYMCQYAQHIPYTPELASKLQERCQKLESSIRDKSLQKLLGQFDTNDSGSATENSLTAVAKEIHEQLTGDGMKHPQFTLEKLPRLLEALLHASVDVQSLKESRISKEIRAIIDAPCIPTISGDGPSIRSRALQCLQRFSTQLPQNALSEDGRSELGLNIPSDTPEEESSLPFSLQGDEIIYKLDEIASKLAQLQDRAKAGDAEGATAVVRQIQEWKFPNYKTDRWGPPEISLAKGISSPLVKAKSALQRSNPSSPSVEHVCNAIQDIVDRVATIQYRAYTPSITGYSYHTPAPTTTVGKIALTFRDAGYSAPRFTCWDHGGYNNRANALIWGDIILTDISLTDPLDLVLRRFFEKANRRYRHPRAPLTDYIISNGEIFNNAGQGAEVATLMTKSYNFAQGMVGLIVPSPIMNEENVVYHFRHDGKFSTNHDELRKFLTKFPTARPAPEQSPDDWLTPEVGPSSGEQNWVKVPAFAFCGNGSDIYPLLSQTHPKMAIAKFIWLPKHFEPCFGLSDITHHRHGPVRVDCAPVKLSPPLTVRDAISLVGRTILYEDPTVDLNIDLNILCNGGHVTRQPPKKKRKVTKGSGKGEGGKDADETQDWNQVFLGFVWGFDEETMEVKVWVYAQSPEVCRTFKVGVPFESMGGGEDDTGDEEGEGRLKGYPQDYPRLRIPVTPKWIGLAVLPGEHTQPGPGASSDVLSSSSPALPTKPVPQPGQDRLSMILASVPVESEVGLEGNCSILVGEIALHGIDSPQVKRIDGCIPGIWQSGRSVEDEGFVIWMQWVKEGVVDWSTHPLPSSDRPQALPLNPDLTWTSNAESVTVDGGSITILSQSIVDPSAMNALLGLEDQDMTERDFVECIVLTGHEDGRYHIPGGISSYTGGDGGFAVDVAKDEQGRAIAIRVRESSGEGMQM